MFEVNGNVYKIEYEELHLMCLRCGRRFGHYVEGCSEKTTVDEAAPNQPEQRDNNGVTKKGCGDG